MYSKTCKFSRSMNSTVCMSILGVGVISAILGIVLGIAANAVCKGNIEQLYSMVAILLGLFGVFFLCLILSAIANSAIEPDFSYTIRVDKEKIFMVFEFTEDDYRVLKTNFEITSKNRKYMTLEDGYARIQIAYDKSVVEFLNGIKK